MTMAHLSPSVDRDRRPCPQLAVTDGCSAGSTAVHSQGEERNGLQQLRQIRRRRSQDFAEGQVRQRVRRLLIAVTRRSFHTSFCPDFSE